MQGCHSWQGRQGLDLAWILQNRKGRRQRLNAADLAALVVALSAKNWLWQPWYLCPTLFCHSCVLSQGLCKIHVFWTGFPMYTRYKNVLMFQEDLFIKTKFRALTSILTKYQYTYQVSVYWYLYLVFRFPHTDTDTSYFKNVLEYWYFQYFSVSVFLKNKK